MWEYRTAYAVHCRITVSYTHLDVYKRQTLHTAVLDKAGTITNGEPEVVTIVGTRSVPAKFLLGMAAGLESQSQDPLARAVMRKAAAENIKLSAVKDVTILDGQGLTGKMAGKVMAGGSAEFIAAQCELTPDLQQAGEQLAADGIAPLYFSLDGHAAGLIGIADAVKPTSKAALDALKALGLDVIDVYKRQALRRQSSPLFRLQPEFYLPLPA